MDWRAVMAGWVCSIPAGLFHTHQHFFTGQDWNRLGNGGKKKRNWKQFCLIDFIFDSAGRVSFHSFCKRSEFLFWLFNTVEIMSTIFFSFSDDGGRCGWPFGRYQNQLERMTKSTPRDFITHTAIISRCLLLFIYRISNWICFFSFYWFEWK